MGQLELAFEESELKRAKLIRDTTLSIAAGAWYVPIAQASMARAAR